MQNIALHYLPLAVAAIAVVVGSIQAKKLSDARTKSHAAITRAALWLVIAFIGGLLFRDEKFVLIVETLALMMLVYGLVQLGRESTTVARISSEQRIDFDTGLYNRRSFDERLYAEHSRTKRTGIDYAIAVFAIDGYESLSPSDRFNSMKLLAKSLDESVRHTDTLARISEDRVAVLMVDTKVEGGVIGVERARERFFFQSCGHDENAHVTRPLTASVGMAAFDIDTVDGQSVIANAEQAIGRLRELNEIGIRIYARGDHSRAASA